MQDGARDRRCGRRQGKIQEVEEEMPKGIRKAPPGKFSPTIRKGDVSMQVKVPPQRKQPPFVKHAPATLPTRMLIRNEDAASMIRLRTPQSPPAQAQEKRIDSMIPSAPPAQPEDVELNKVREAIFEIMGMHWMESVEVTNMIPKLKGRGIQVDKVLLCWVVQEDPQYSFVPAGSNDAYYP